MVQGFRLDVDQLVFLGVKNRLENYVGARQPQGHCVDTLTKLTNFFMQPDYFILIRLKFLLAEKMWPQALHVIKMGHPSERVCIAYCLTNLGNGVSVISDNVALIRSYKPCVFTCYSLFWFCNLVFLRRSQIQVPRK